MSPLECRPYRWSGEELISEWWYEEWDFTTRLPPTTADYLTVHPCSATEDSSAGRVQDVAGRKQTRFLTTTSTIAPHRGPRGVGDDPGLGVELSVGVYGDGRGRAAVYYLDVSVLVDAEQYAHGHAHSPSVPVGLRVPGGCDRTADGGVAHVGSFVIGRVRAASGERLPGWGSLVGSARREYVAATV